MASWLNKKQNQLPSSEYLKDNFVYQDGELLWRVMEPGKRRRVAGCVDSSHGYAEIRLNGVRYYVHRLIWAYFNGPISDGMSVDHINHNIFDNKIENLRLVSHQNNHRNQRIRRNNKSGVMGVGFDKSRGKWLAQIMVDGKGIHLGRFNTIKEATQARLNANKKYGFHENHGAL